MYLEIIHFYHGFDLSVGLYCIVCIKKSWPLIPEQIFHYLLSNVLFWKCIDQ